jgi:hypothetical protein
MMRVMQWKDSHARICADVQKMLSSMSIDPALICATRNRLYIEGWQAKVFKTAYDKGWWEDIDTTDVNVISSKLALIHSEISEALEELRVRDDLNMYYSCPVCKTTDMTPAMPGAAVPPEGGEPELRHVCKNEHSFSQAERKPEGFAVELADAIIRIFDLAEALNLSIEEALVVKARYNDTRPYKHGGKAL